MILQNSYYSNLFSSGQLKQVRQMMKSIKSPFMNKIEEAKKHFHQKIKRMGDLPKDQIVDLQQQQSSSDPTQRTITSCQRLQRPNMEARIFTQSSCQQNLVIKQEPYFEQWVMGKNDNSIFNRMDQIAEHYNRVFQKKIKFAKFSNANIGESYKIQQKTVIEKIYSQIGNLSQQSVTFKNILQLFSKCPLFYRIYNIHPQSIMDVLRDSAHNFQNKLTQQQFMNLFLLNSRTNMDFQNYSVNKISKKCVLKEQQWNELRQLFTIFDTFGSETIKLRQFFQKVKVSLQHKHLLQMQVLHFPNIMRSYKLKKILFELQYKLKIGQTMIKWQDVRSLIQNFKHIKEPTIDVIQKQNISAGKITVFSNGFMIKDQILDYIKEIYSKCPKYCQNFVKISHFCNEVYDSQKSKIYLTQIVRNVPEIVTVKQVLSKLCNQTYKYMDLDQILQQFSLKVAINQKRKSKVFLQDWNNLSESDDQDIIKKNKQSHRPNKHTHKAPNRQSQRYQSIKQNTVIKQFNLSKKTKQSIRDVKVNQMIQEKEYNERKQYNKKFKANPIPASINSQKYLQYQQKMSKKKEALLTKLKQTNQKDAMLLKYLQANTNLFKSPKKLQIQQNPNVTNFQAKQIPWFVHVDLLDTINEGKLQKSKQIKKQTNLKYLKQWKKLPSFFMDNLIPSNENLPKAGSQTALLAEEEQIEQFKEALSRKSKVKEVPNFQLLQNAFSQFLQNKKKQFKPTKIIQFNLTSPKAKDKQPELNQSKTKSQSCNKKKQFISTNTNYIGSTLKFQSLVRHNQEKKVLQQMQKQQQMQQQIQRAKNSELFARLLRKQLKKQIKSTKSSGFGCSSKKLRAASQNNKANKQLSQIYKRVFSRPFLFQSTGSNFKSNEINHSSAEPIKMRDQNYEINQIIQFIQPKELQYKGQGQEKQLQMFGMSHQSI